MIYIQLIESYDFQFMQMMSILTRMDTTRKFKSSKFFIFQEVYLKQEFQKSQLA